MWSPVNAVQPSNLSVASFTLYFICTPPRVTHSACAQSDKTHVSGVQCGTPLYIAPELSLIGKASTASDVYSFGVMLWELYHGISAWQHAVKT